MISATQRAGSPGLFSSVAKLAALVSLILSVCGVSAQFTDQCTYKQLPIFVGGASDEYVNCVIYDPKTQTIVLGGNTTSVNFAPAGNDHAFLIGLDVQGNWQWGKFFYNVSYAISDISGCKMSSDGSSLSLFAMSNSQPVVMDINTRDGSINKFFSLEYTAATTAAVPVFVTYGALYYDKQDSYDGQAYVYESFLMDDKVEMLRMLVSTSTPVIDWSYEFYDYTTAEAEAIDRRKDPAFMHMDPLDDTIFYLSGRYQGRASVMKFFKRTGKMIWWNKFGALSNIRAIQSVPNDSVFYGCGDYWANEAAPGIDDLATKADYEAGIFKMQNDGRVKWYR